MKIHKIENLNFVFDIKELEKITKLNIYNIINILSKRSHQINKEINIYLQFIFNKYKYSSKKYKYLKKYTRILHSLPNTTYLSVLELINKDLIYKKKKINEKNR